MSSVDHAQASALHICVHLRHLWLMSRFVRRPRLQRAKTSASSVGQPLPSTLPTLPKFSPFTFCASRTVIPSHARFRVDSFPPSDFSELQKPLDHFRAKTKRLKIHPLEILVLWIVATHLVFLPWAIGAMAVWGQFVSLGFAVLGFIFALWPRSYTEEHTGSNTFRLVMWPRTSTCSSKATISRGRPSDLTKVHDKPGALERRRDLVSAKVAILR